MPLPSATFTVQGFSCTRSVSSADVNAGGPYRVTAHAPFAAPFSAASAQQDVPQFSRAATIRGPHANVVSSRSWPPWALTWTANLSTSARPTGQAATGGRVVVVVVVVVVVGTGGAVVVVVVVGGGVGDG